MSTEIITDYKAMFENLQGEHEQLLARYEKQSQQFNDLSVSFAGLSHELDQLKRMIFGSRHERFVPSSSPSQLTLDMQGQSLPPTAETTTQDIAYTRTKPERDTVTKIPTGRMKLPESLPRQQVIIEPVEDVSGWKKIGEEITEELDIKAAVIFVRQFIRPKYLRPTGDKIAIAELPARPIDKAIAGPGLLAQIVIDKYMDHLPLYRQQERFKRAGILLPESTIGGWVSSVCRLIEPLYDSLKKAVLQTSYLHVDETPIKVLDKEKKGTTHRGYYWVYQNSIQRMVLFDYRPGRGREGPEDLLKNFQGYLQTDGYGVYDGFDKKPDITLMHCMAHARRMFDEALNNDRLRAEYALTQIQQLYAIERRAQELSLPDQEIAALRQEKSVPILAAMKQWMTDQYPQVPPQSSIAKAIAYSLSRWEKLSIYTRLGNLQIDNNPVENCIRPVALGRKNYLFAGSHEAAQRSAMLYSLIGTCKLHNLNPYDWLKDILVILPTHPINRIKELLPYNWKNTENN
jgi:transposase